MNSLSAIESIFFAALEKPTPQERAAYLDQACGPDSELRGCVERLLQAHPHVGSFLQSPALPLTVDAPGSALPPTTEEAALTERPGSRIGPYKLMEQIGEGGMGLVFVAEQLEPVRRKVALKVIKPGMDSRQVIARFEAERQALALMDHPNIARVLDADTTPSGRPYFVMELVKGIPIVEYCDQQQLSTRERLDLFLSLCQAVQHAHGKGIIHRDLKPSNILVAPHDGVPVVKVIDFGVAKAIGQQLTDKTIYTRFTQMIGTPLYMSPEQAEVNALDVDIRSDVYSLGVVLYELLTGTTPFERERFARAAYDEIRRILREEEPPRPSTRLSTQSGTLPVVAARRKTAAAQLSALVKGDLDWIVMKALEKDRNRRYETASAFAADVRRFLTEEPVEARPPSAWYRFRKLARRNKVALTTAALIAAALLLGTIVSLWQAALARESAREADRQKEVAQESERRANEEGDKVEATLAHSLLRPLGYRDGPLTPAEAAAVLDLAHADSDRLSLRFFATALERPETAERLARRCEWVTQAAVGLRLDRRERVLQLVRARLGDEQVPLAVREACVELGHVLGDKDEDFRARARQTRHEVVVRTAHPGAYAQRVVMRRLRLDPDEASALVGRFLDAVDRREVSALSEQSYAVGRLVEQLSPVEVEAAMTRALNVLVRTDDPSRGESVATVATQLAWRLEPDAAAAITDRVLDRIDEAAPLRDANRLLQLLHPLLWRAGPRTTSAAIPRAVQILSKTDDPAVLVALVGALGPRWPEGAKTGAPVFAARLLELIKRRKGGDAGQGLARLLNRVAEHLEPTEAERVCAAAVGVAIDVLAGPFSSTGTPEQSTAVQLLAGRLGPAQAEAQAGKLLEAMSRLDRSLSPTAAYHLELQAKAAVALAGQLKPQEKRRVLSAVVDRLLVGMDRPTSLTGVARLLAALCDVADRLLPEEAAQTCSAAATKVRAAVVSKADPLGLQQLGLVLLSLADRLPPEEGADMISAAVSQCLQLMGTTIDPNADTNLAFAIQSLAGRLGPQEARASVQKLIHALAGVDDPRVLEQRVHALAAFGEHLKPADAAAIAHRALDALDRTDNPEHLRFLGQVVATLMARLRPGDANSAARQLAATLARMKNPLALAALGPAVEKVAAQLGLMEAAALVDKFLDAITRSESVQPALRTNHIQLSAQALPALAVRLSPHEAAAAAVRLFDLMYTLDEPFAFNPLDKAAVALVAPCETPDLMRLLEHPTCVQGARQAVLNELSRRAERPFEDVWAFVEWAHEPRHLRAMELQRLGRLKEAAALYDELIAADDTSWRERFQRGRWLAELAEYSRAADDFAAVTERGRTDWEVLVGLGVTRLLADDTAGYRRDCRRLLDRHDKSNDLDLLIWVAGFCKLAPIAAKDTARALAMAERSLRGAPQNPFHLSTRAALLYRAGQYEEAIRDMQAAERAYGPNAIWTWAWLAMAHQRLGKLNEAKSYLDRARPWLKSYLDSGATPRGWSGPLRGVARLEMRLLYQEAEEVVAGKATGPRK